ncbi:hypothetical protein Tco_0729873 [Tanacetum coccineum]|uniref:Uncharacterized protein n=1 Tax=Tanacetum coccineum TaxID=301880 RepID=A0ABQ4YSW4_9ASTR
MVLPLAPGFSVSQGSRYTEKVTVPLRSSSTPWIGMGIYPKILVGGFVLMARQTFLPHDCIMKIDVPFSFCDASVFFPDLLVLALLLPCLISLTRCANCPDLTASSIYLFKCKQSSVLWPLSPWKSHHLFLFLDSGAPIIGG